MAERSPENNGALIGGIVGGILAALLLLGALIAFLVLRRRHEKPEKDSVGGDFGMQSVPPRPESTSHRSEYAFLSTNLPGSSYAEIHTATNETNYTMGEFEL